MPNLSCRNWRMSIGGREYKPCVTGFDGADAKLPTGGGLILFTGRMTLAYPDTGWDESLDDRANPRWAKGTPVLIEFQDDANLWKTVRGCHLFVIESLYNPQNYELELQLGDELSLLSFAEPPGDKSGICLGTAVGKTGVISTLLAAAGASGLTGSIGGVINSPSPKLLQGSYIEQAGAIAASEGAFLSVNRNGVISLREAWGAGGTVITIDVANDTSDHKRIYGEQPAKTMVAQGSAAWVTANGLGYSSSGFETAPAAIAGSNSLNEIVSRRWQRSEFFSRDYREIDEFSQEALGSLLPEDYPGHTGTIESERKFERYYYRKTAGTGCEDQAEYRLIQKVLTTWQVKAVALREVYASYPKNQRLLGGWSSLVLSERTTTNYDHGQPVGPDEEGLERRAEGVKISTIVERCIGAITPTEYSYKASGTRAYPEDLEINSSHVQRWDEIRLKEWQYTEIQKESIATAKPDVADKIRENAKATGQTVSEIALAALITTKNEVTVSNTGNTQPPAPETPPAQSDSQQAQVTGKAAFPADSQNQYREKEKAISFEYLTGTSIGAVKGQAISLADKWGRAIWARYKGLGLQTGFDQHWFGYEPFAEIHLLEEEGKSKNWGEMFSISISQQEAVIGIDCAFQGWMSAALPTSPLIPLADTAVFDVTIVGHGYATGDLVEVI